MVPFVFVADTVVLSVLMYTEGGSTVVCHACELFLPLHVQSGLAFVYLLTVSAPSSLFQKVAFWRLLMAKWSP